MKCLHSQHIRNLYFPAALLHIPHRTDFLFPAAFHNMDKNHLHYFVSFLFTLPLNVFYYDPDTKSRSCQFLRIQPFASDIIIL